MIRLYAYAALALVLIGAAGYVVHLKSKADKYESAREALAGEKKRHIADLAQVEKSLALSLQQREALQKGLNEITHRFNSVVVPPSKTLVRIVEKAGACPSIGVSDSYVRLWNDSSNP